MYLKDVFDYISNNAFLTTLCGTVIGWILSQITMYIERKYRKKEERSREKKEQWNNKPVLEIIKNNTKQKPDEEFFIAPFNVAYDENNNFDFIYSKNILDKKRHEHIDITFKNIGKSYIKYFDIVSTYKKGIAVFNYSSLKTVVSNKAVIYNGLYEKMIGVNETAKIRIYYEKGNAVCLTFSSALAIMVEDSYGNFWEQPLFYERKTVYPPIAKNYKDYRESIAIDSALDYFEMKGKHKRK